MIWQMASRSVACRPLNEPVVDQGNLLSAAEKQAISQKILQLHEQGKAQIGVVIVPTTGQEDIFDYAMRVAEKWQLGSAKRDNGILMAIAVNDRQNSNPDGLWAGRNHARYHR